MSRKQKDAIWLMAKKCAKSKINNQKQRSPANKTKKPKSINEGDEMCNSMIERMIHALTSNDLPSENLDALRQMRDLILTTISGNSPGVAGGGGGALRGNWSFTSIPQILKLLSTHYGKLKTIYDQKRDPAVKRAIAELVSFVATAKRPDDPNDGGDVLRYYRRSSADSVDRWGIAYVRDLAKDIVETCKVSSQNEYDEAELRTIAHRCAEYFIKQNSELEACDLLLEIEQIAEIGALIETEDVCGKVCDYVTICARYFAEPNCRDALYVVINLWLKFGRYVDALFAAIELRCSASIEKIFGLAERCELSQKQMALIVGRHNIVLRNLRLPPAISALAGNECLHSYFVETSRQLDLIPSGGIVGGGSESAAKIDTMLRKLLRYTFAGTAETRTSWSEKKTLEPDPLASIALANAFLNAGFGDDSLSLVCAENTSVSSSSSSSSSCNSKSSSSSSSSSSSCNSKSSSSSSNDRSSIETAMRWIAKHNEDDRFNACASLGLLCLWDIRRASTVLAPYLRVSSDSQIKAGALAAIGIARTGIRCDESNETKDKSANSKSAKNDDLCSVLRSHLSNKNDNNNNSVKDGTKAADDDDESGKNFATLQFGALMGISLAYLGTGRRDMIEPIIGVLRCEKTIAKNSRLAAIACGLISNTHVDGSLIATLIEALYKRQQQQQQSPEQGQKPKGSGGCCELSDSVTRNLAHAIGLCVMGKVSLLPTLLEAIEPLQRAGSHLYAYLKLFLEICCYVGSSNILKIQQLLKLCASGGGGRGGRPASPSSAESLRKKERANPNSESRLRKSRKTMKKKKRKMMKMMKTMIGAESSIVPKEKCGNWLRILAILGVSLITIGDDELNSKMVMRDFGLLLRSSNDAAAAINDSDDENDDDDADQKDARAKNAIIYAIAMMNVSNPQAAVIELLQKYCHIPETSSASIVALGLIGAGTRNTKVAKVLTDCIRFYSRAYALKIRHLVRISLGLLHLGRGSLTLCPRMEGDGRRLVRFASIAGIVAFVLQLLDDSSGNNGLISSRDWIPLLAAAIRPKMLITLDGETMRSIAVPIRVGQAIDTTGRAGDTDARSVTAFQTVETPVLLSAVGNEKAELACGDDFETMTRYLDGFVIVKRKPKPKSSAQPSSPTIAIETISKNVKINGGEKIENSSQRKEQQTSPPSSSPAEQRDKQS